MTDTTITKPLNDALPKAPAVDYPDIVRKGLWSNNPALVQLLGLCPLLAVSGSVVNSLGLALGTLLVLTSSNIAISLIRNVVSNAVRLPAFVMIIAALTTCIELLVQAFTYELYLILGIFIPLIATNCTVLGRAEAFASKHGVVPSAVDGFMMGMGFGLVLIVIGALRELLGSGTLFADMHLIFGEPARQWEIQVFSSDYPGFLLAILPPGAFIITGFLVALKNIIDMQLKRRADERRTRPVKGNRRVRTTGHIS